MRLQILMTAMLAISIPVNDAFGAACMMDRKPCECNLSETVSVISRVWPVKVNSGGTDVVSRTIEILNKKQDQEKNSISQVISGKAQFPKDADSVSTFRDVSNTTIVVVFGKNQCAIGIATANAAGITSMDPVAFFMMFK